LVWIAGGRGDVRDELVVRYEIAISLEGGLLYSVPRARYVDGLT